MTMLNEILDPTLDSVFFMLSNERYVNEFLAPLCASIANISLDEVDKIKVIDPRVPIETPKEKRGTVDVLIRTKKGSTIHIEIQHRYFKHMAVRTNMQHSKLYGSQLNVKSDYSNVQRTITLVITKHRLFEKEDYFSRYVMMNPETGKVFDDKSEIYVLVLSKLPKESDQKPEWAWGRFFKAKTREELDMLAQSYPIVKGAVTVLKELSTDEDLRMRAERELIARLDEIDWELTVREEAREETWEEVAHMLRAEGDTEEKVIRLTGYSFRELDALK